MSLILPTPRPERILTQDDLRSHQRFGIDFDGTLVGHEKSKHLQEFIVTHSLEKEFFIVTFRSHGRELEIAEDLRESIEKDTGTRIRLFHFRDIHNMPDDDYARTNGSMRIPEFYQWKPAKCRQLGCSILIDDMADYIHPHCENGLICVHPDDLLF
jgi:hypothetical protein